MTMKVCEAIADALAIESGGPIFGLMGDANMAVWGSLCRDDRVHMVWSRHENGAIAMADGYAQASGRLAVATVTCGPGLSNAANALLSAARAGSPIVVFTGDYVPDGGKGNLQALDQALFARACESVYRPLLKTETLAEDIAEGCYIARTRSCPVVLGLPSDLWEATLPWDWSYRSSEEHLGRREFAPPAAQVDEMAELLAQAQRPVLIAGRGAERAAARRELERLGDLTGALLGTSLVGKGFFDGHPWDIGIAGSFSSAASEALFAEADLVFGFGASLNFFTTEGGMLFPSARVVRVDLKPPTSIGFTPGTFMQGDARLAAAALADALHRRGVTAREGYRTAQSRDLLARRPAAPARATDGLDPRELMRALAPALAPRTQVVSGAGHFWAWGIAHLPLPPEGRFQHTAAFGSIGLGLAHGIGAAVANPDRPTLLIEGDGGLLQAVQELHSAAEQKVRLVILVMNDSGYGAEVLKMKWKGRSTRDASWTSPDFVALARAFGGDGVRLERESDLPAAIERGRAFDGPFLIDARISPTTVSDTYARLHLGEPNAIPLLRPVSAAKER